MPVRNISATSLALASLGATVTGYIIYKFVSWKFWREPQPADAPPVRVCNYLADWVTNEKKYIKILTEAKVIGLDCEWVTINEQRNPVALLQLATADGFCVLIRLCNIPPWLMPSGLVDILSDDKIMKVGVGICEDAQKLLQDYGIIVRGCLDLRQIVQDDAGFTNKGLGLQVLAEVFLDAKLKKTVSLSCSNWEAEHLSPKQIAYAAEDALASAQIYEKLIERREKEKKPISIEIMDKALVDMPYKRSFQKKTSENSTDRIPPLTPYKERRLKKVRPRCKLMYDNCQLQAPDGETLCSCDKKKAQWYIEKGRATLISEEPFIVRLNFEPSGRPILDNKYYVQEKQNCCVVCGETKFFFRKSVVPSEYRRYFPNLMKRYLSHDVLLLCVTCHRRSNLLDQKLRQQLAKECDAPIEIGQGLKVRSNQELALVKSAGKALLKSGDRIPAKRKEELEKRLKKHYQVEDLSEELLKKASRIRAYTVNDSYVPHGWKVFQHVCKNGGLIAFETRWRKHFLDTMKPMFLPTMWSVDHNHERLALQVSKNKVDFDVSILGLSEELIEKVKKLEY